MSSLVPNHQGVAIRGDRRCLGAEPRLNAAWCAGGHGKGRLTRNAVVAPASVSPEDVHDAGAAGIEADHIPPFTHPPAGGSMVYVATMEGESPLATLVVTDVDWDVEADRLSRKDCQGLIDEELNELAPVSGDDDLLRRGGGGNFRRGRERAHRPGTRERSP